MKRNLMKTWRQYLQVLWSDESGQGMAEYSSITAVMFLGMLATGLNWPWTQKLFQGLQTYIDFYYYCLNVAVG